MKYGINIGLGILVINNLDIAKNLQKYTIFSYMLYNKYSIYDIYILNNELCNY